MSRLAVAGATAVAIAGLSLFTGIGPAGAAPRKSPAALVPKSIRAKGTLKVATEAGFAPFEMIDKSHQIVGFDISIIRAVAKELNIKIKIVNTSFTAIIPSMASGRYQLAISGIEDTKTREKVVDLVDYVDTGTVVVVMKGNPEHLTDASLCGKKVGYAVGTTQQTVVEPALEKACTAAGKAAIQTSSFPTQPDSTLAMKAGRIDATLAAASYADYLLKQQPGKYQILPGVLDPAPVGIAVTKTSGLAKPVEAALDAMIKDGTYHKIIKQWDFSGALKRAKINGADT